MSKKVTIFSPNYYTYGAMVIGGILKLKNKVNLVNNITNNNINLFLNSDVVIFSLYSTSQIIDNNLKNIINFIKSKSKNNTKIYVGGPVSSYYEIILGEIPSINGVIVGEGELIIENIINENCKEGLAYIENNEIVYKKSNLKIETLNYNLLIPNDINKQNIRGANVYIETHRGCIGNCTFCQVPKYFGKDIRNKQLEDIIKEVKEFKKKGVKKIAISGGTGSLYNFKKTVNKSSFIELIREISNIVGKNNLSVPDMRVDYVDEETLKAIKDYTISWVFFGLESGSNKILRNMKKGVSVEKNLNAIELAKQCGVKVGGSFIVGTPDEKEIDYLLTKDFIVSSELDDIFVSMAEPIPKTELCNLVLNTDLNNNPMFKKHKGVLKRFNLTEGEFRCFDLLIHSENWKSNPTIVNNKLKAIFLNEAKRDGLNIRNITNTIFKYKNYLL